jgi:hypothetical protein
MKASFISACIVTFLIHSATCQTVTFEIDTLTGFCHDASITTHQANVTNQLYGGNTFVCKAKFIFDFTRMTVCVVGNNQICNFSVFELKRYDESDKTFNASYYDSIEKTNFNIITSKGVDSNDGIVFYMRFSDEYEGKNIIRGAFQNNVTLK